MCNGCFWDLGCLVDFKICQSRYLSALSVTLDNGGVLGLSDKIW